jgi:hypothetical protein
LARPFENFRSLATFDQATDSRRPRIEEVDDTLEQMFDWSGKLL